jgi:hypothetical protein
MRGNANRAGSTAAAATVVVIISLALGAVAANAAVVLDLRATAPNSVLNTSNVPVTSNNEQVGKWLDQSPAANDAVASDAFPQYKDAANGGPALRFHQGNSNMNLDEPLITSTTYFKILARINLEDTGDATSNNQERFIAGNYGFGNFTGLEFEIYTRRVGIYIGYTNQTLLGTTQLNVGQWYDVGVQRVGDTYTVLLNGVPDGSMTAASGGAFTGNVNFSVGGAPNYSPVQLGMMSSISVEVPEPAGTATLGCAAAGGLLLRRGRRW